MAMRFPSVVTIEHDGIVQSKEKNISSMIYKYIRAKLGATNLEQLSKTLENGDNVYFLQRKNKKLDILGGHLNYGK